MNENFPNPENEKPSEPKKRINPFNLMPRQPPSPPSNISPYSEIKKQPDPLSLTPNPFYASK
ncbi:MAG: hypothetical protein AABZ60_13750, partial [Planctomycetota bacterium]